MDASLPADELAEASLLTTEETGALYLLKCVYWLQGSLPDDDARLARLAKVSPEMWPAIRAAIEPLFGQGWRHARIDELRTQAQGHRDKKAAAGRKGAESRWGDGKANGNRNGVAIGNRNGKANGTATGFANGNRNAGAMATTSIVEEEALRKEAPTRTHTPRREAIPPFRSRTDAEAWLLRQDVFPGDLTALTTKWKQGDLEWSDVERSAA